MSIGAARYANLRSQSGCWIEKLFGGQTPEFRVFIHVVAMAKCKALLGQPLRRDGEKEQQTVRK